MYKLKIFALSFLLLNLTSAILLASGSKVVEKQQKKMENKLSIAENPYNSNSQRISALMAIVKDKEILKYLKLKEKFKQHLWRLIQDNKTKELGGPIILIIGMITQPPFYKESPSKEEQRLFLDLLTDNNNSPVARAASAYFLRNASIPEVKEKVRYVAEDLYKEYIKNPKLKDSRAVGLLGITLGRMYKFDPDELLNAKNPMIFLQKKRLEFLMEKN